MEYLEVPQEAPAITSVRPPAYWPSSNGELVIQNLAVKYASELPSVLHDLSFTVRPAEKVGVVSVRIHNGQVLVLMCNLCRSAERDLVWRNVHIDECRS